MNFSWSGVNVFITGINGFVGGNVAKKLVDLGANVFGLIRTKKYNSFLFFENTNKKISLIHGELCDLNLLSRIISEEHINIIFHFAAQVEVGIGLKNPFITFDTNLRGTYTLLESARLYPDALKAIVVASSDKSYGEYPKEKMPYKEDYQLKPKFPYDTSKACADMIAKSYASGKNNLPIVVTRFANIYGPGQLNFSALIPDGISSALGYTKFIPRGDGSMMRDYLYIEDVVDLYLRIAGSLSGNQDRLTGQVFNAGSNKARSVREVLEKIFTLNEKPHLFNEILKLMKNKKTVGEINFQFMDYKKVNEYFGWYPKNSFDDGIEKTVDWYKRYFRHMRSY